QVRKFPQVVLTALRRYADEVIEEMISSDEAARKIYASFSAFRKDVTSWAQVSEKVYYALMGT
ncbi:MAG: ABC transporter substrate-binding protein, partial [Calditrichaeota bacterium]